MKATGEKQRKRTAVGTSNATRKAVSKSAAGMPVARALTEHVVQFTDGSSMKMYAPTGTTSKLREKVAKTKDFGIVEVGTSSKVVVRGVVRRQCRLGKVAALPHPAPERASDEIVTMAAKLTGTKAKAKDWYRTFPIPAFGGVTAEFLVDHGRAKEVRDYLNAVVLGEFA